MKYFLLSVLIFVHSSLLGQENICPIQVKLQIPPRLNEKFNIEIIDFHSDESLLNTRELENFHNHLLKISSVDPRLCMLLLKNDHDSILARIGAFLISKELTQIEINYPTFRAKITGGENEYMQKNEYLLFYPPSLITENPIFSIDNIKKQYGYSPLEDGNLYAYYNEYEQNVLDHVKNYRNSYYTLYMLVKRAPFLSIQLLETCALIFDKNLLTTEVGKKLTNMIDHSKDLMIGKKFPNSEILSLGRKGYNLEFLYKPKNYTLIDFWASWCGPCRRSIQNLQALYPKIDTSKFSILLISIDTDFEKWQQASKEDHIFLMNYIDKNYQKKEIENKYNLNYIPQNYLVDANGKIIESNIASEKLEEFLQTHNLLRKK